MLQDYAVLAYYAVTHLLPIRAKKNDGGKRLVTRDVYLLTAAQLWGKHCLFT